MMATNSPLFTEKAHIVQGAHLGLPFAIHLGKMFYAQNFSCRVLPICTNMMSTVYPLQVTLQ